MGYWAEEDVQDWEMDQLGLGILYEFQVVRNEKDILWCTREKENFEIKFFYRALAKEEGLVVNSFKSGWLL